MAFNLTSHGLNALDAGTKMGQAVSQALQDLSLEHWVSLGLFAALLVLGCCFLSCCCRACRSPSPL